MLTISFDWSESNILKVHTFVMNFNNFERCSPSNCWLSDADEKRDETKAEEENESKHDEDLLNNIFHF